MSTTPRTAMRFAGWPLVGWSALGLTAMAAGILGTRGFGEAGLHTLIRATAQTSFVLFISAFIASALARRWRTPSARWLLRNRRYLGVSFAVSHFLHLAAILTLVRVARGRFQIDPVTLIGGGLAYVFIAAMTATSFDRTAAWIGPRAWKWLHTIGAHYIWLIFVLQYVVLVSRSLVYAPFAVIAVAAMALRILARLNAPRVFAPASARP